MLCAPSPWLTCHGQIDLESLQEAIGSMEVEAAVEVTTDLGSAEVVWRSCPSSSLILGVPAAAWRFGSPHEAESQASSRAGTTRRRVCSLAKWSPKNR